MKYKHNQNILCNDSLKLHHYAFMLTLSLVFFPSFTIHSKTCVKRSLKNTKKLVFKTNKRLMQGKSIAE